MTNPLFIVFEGGEGSGKTTQSRLLSQALSEKGIPNLLTREPGDTALGKELRYILLDKDREPISRRAEMLLFAAERAEHVEKVIKPALARGEIVICDRYSASTVAYQAYAGGLDVEPVTFISQWASESLTPDITYFLDVEPSVGLERVRREDRNRYEAKTLKFHEDVRLGFFRQRDSSWVTLVGELGSDVTRRLVMAHLQNKMSMTNKKPAWLTKHPCHGCDSGYIQCMQGANMDIQCCAICYHPGRWSSVIPYTDDEIKEMQWYQQNLPRTSL